MIPLSAKRRSELRGEAHKLDAVVLIGDKGLTEEVLAEIDRALKAHELVKVRAGSADRDARGIWLDTITTRLQAHAVQQIGKVFVIYRENPAEETPRRADPVASPARAGVRDDVVSQRGRQRQRSRDQDKRRERDIRDMQRKGKIPATAKSGPGPSPATPGARGEDRKRVARKPEPTDVKGTSRPRSRTPSPLPESGPRRRRPRTSR